MNRFTLLVVAFIMAFAAISCSSDSTNAVAPDLDSNLTSGHEGANGSAQLWGYYDIYFDFENQTVEAVMNRDVMFSVNIVSILNKHPGTLGFSFNGTDMQPGYLDVSLDLSITHPFDGNEGLNGYDVRGILITDGSGTMGFNSDLKYSVNGTDQSLLNADGYSRWFNKTEFTYPGLFGYTPGIAASKKLTGDATINPYKLFADGLAKDQDTYEFLTDNPGNHGVFSSGATNTRVYELRFPLPTPAVQYGYAIVANWKSILPGDHPSNAHEAVGCTIEVTPNIYYIDATDNGGNLILDFWLAGWDGEPDDIYIESTVFSSYYEFTSSEKVPVDSGTNWAKWSVVVPADNVTGTEDNEFWIIAVYNDYDYSCPFGVPNDASDEPVTACFRFDLFVDDESNNLDPVCDLVVIGNNPSYGYPAAEMQFNASGSYDPNPYDILSYEWDFDGTGYVSGASIKTHAYTENYDGPVLVRVTDGNGGEDICQVDVVAYANTLYYYDGMIDNGNMVVVKEEGLPAWTYCTDKHAWDENFCGPHFTNNYSLVITPTFNFPQYGFTTIHLEVWHWGEMKDDGSCYGTPGVVDFGSFPPSFEANRSSDRLVYIEGFDFNDGAFADWKGTFGTESSPEWSHFDCSDYSGNKYAVGFEFHETSGSNPGGLDGWNIRKIIVWVE